MAGDLGRLLGYDAGPGPKGAPAAPPAPVAASAGDIGSLLGYDDPKDFTDRYNTPLPAGKEAAYEQWAKSVRQDPVQGKYDYDLQGAFVAGLKPGSNGHLDDKFKKPNHPTFSTQSMYSGADGFQGGEWQQTQGGRWSFRPSQTNLQFHPGNELNDYFRKREPGNQLLAPLPSQTVATPAQAAADTSHVAQTVAQAMARPAGPQILLPDDPSANPPEKKLPAVPLATPVLRRIPGSEVYAGPAEKNPIGGRNNERMGLVVRGSMPPKEQPPAVEGPTLRSNDARDQNIWPYLKDKFREPIVTDEDVDKYFGFLVGPFALHKGLIKAGARMTSPENAAITAATMGFGSVPGATAAAVRSGLSIYFATEAGKGLLEKYPELQQRVKAGDWQGALELGGQTLMDAAMFYGAGVHGLSEGLSVPDEARAARARRSARAADRQPAPPSQQPTSPLNLGQILYPEEQANEATSEKQSAAQNQPEGAKPAAGQPDAGARSGVEPAADAARPVGFETAKGSRYKLEGKGTSRSKTATGEEFGPSDRTVYITPETNQRVMEHLQANNIGDTKASIRSVGDGQVGIVVKDRATGEVREDLSRTVPFSEKPEVGLHPVEIWDKNPETGEYGFHVGHAITKLEHPEAPAEAGAGDGQAAPGGSEGPEVRRRVSLGGLFGSDSPYAQKYPNGIPRHVAEWAIHDIARETGVTVHAIDHGAGVYKGDAEPVAHAEISGTKDQVRDFMDTAGLGMQQTEVMAARPTEGPEGKHTAIDIVQKPGDNSGRSLADGDTAIEFWRTVEKHLSPELQGLTEEQGRFHDGFQQLTLDGQPALRTINFGGEWDDRLIDQFHEAVDKAADEMGIKVNFDRLKAELLNSKSAWKDNPNGELYRQGLDSRGRSPLHSEYVDRTFRPAFEQQIEDHQRAGSGTPGAGPGPAAAATEPAAAEPERQSFLERLDQAGRESDEWLRRNADPGTLNSNRIADPEFVRHMARSIAGSVARGALTFERFAREAVEKYGERIRPHLEAIWEQASEFARAVKPTLNDTINARRRVYHATDLDGFKGILNSGEIRPSGYLPAQLKTFEEMGFEKVPDNRLAGVSVSRVPRVASKANKAVTFVIDPGEAPRLRPFAEPDYGKTRRRWPFGGNGKQPFEERNPHFEFEDRTFNEPVPLSAAKGVIVDREALAQGIQADPSKYWPSDLSLHEYGRIRTFDGEHKLNQKILKLQLERIREAAAAKGLPVRVVENGRELHSYRAGFFLDRLAEKGRESDEWLRQNGYLSGATLGANNYLNPEFIKHAARSVAGSAARGALGFDEFRRNMVAAYGAKIRPALNEIWEQAKQGLEKGAKVWKPGMPLEEAAGVEVPKEGKRVSKKDVTRYLDAQTRHALGSVPASESDAVKLKRLMKLGRKEIADQLKRPENGVNWYSEDTKLADRHLATVFPELAEDRDLNVFQKAISAVMSNNSTPETEAYYAAKIYAATRDTGKIPLKQPNGKEWPAQGAGIQLRKIQAMIDERGIDGFVDFLTREQKVSEVKKWRKGQKGKKDELVPGSMVLGPKLGRYLYDLLGVKHNGSTVDKWDAQAQYRRLGRLMRRNGSITDAPSPESERAVFMDMHRRLAQEFGIERPSGAQSALWHYEQELYRRLGLKVKTTSRSTGTLRYITERGVNYVDDRNGADGAGTPPPASSGPEEQGEGRNLRGAGEAGGGGTEPQGQGVLERLRRAGKQSDEWLRKNGITGGGSSSANRFLDPEVIYHLTRSIAGDVASGAITLREAAQKVFDQIKDKFPGFSLGDISQRIAEHISEAHGNQPSVQPSKLGALQPVYERAVASMRESAEEMKALKQKREEALDALKASETTPEQKQHGAIVRRYFTGERDVWGARVNQAIERLRKLVPDRTEQEALSLMRDFRNRPGELEAFYRGTHPDLVKLPKNEYAAAMKNLEKLRPAMEKALKPTPRMQAADMALTEIADRTLAEGQKSGVVGGNVKNALQTLAERMPTKLFADPAVVEALAKGRFTTRREIDEFIDRIQPAIDSKLKGGELVEAHEAMQELQNSIASEEYVAHLLHPQDEEPRPMAGAAGGSAMGGKIGRNFGFANERKIPTLPHAVAMGIAPRTLNAFDAMTIHGDKFATARATRMLVERLKNAGVGKWGARSGQGNIPEGWVEIAPHAHPFQNLRTFTDEAGETNIARQTLFVPKFIEEALRPVTDPDYTNRIAGFRKLRTWQALTKSVELGLSLFHLKAENFMALANMGPKGWLKAQLADRASAEFLEAERDMVLHGGTSPVQGKTFEAYKSLEPGSIPTWGEIALKAPVVKQMNAAAGKLSQFIFDNQMRRFKVVNYALRKAAWVAKNPNATAAETSAAMHSIASELNAVYGGLNWENLGANKATVEVARAIMLAPDWTISNFFNVKTLFEGGWKGTEGAKMARMFWIRAMVGGLAATQGMSLLMSGKPSKRSTMVYMGKDPQGREIYQNLFFAGAPSDVVNLVNNVHDYGAVLGLAKSVAGKEAPALRTATNLLMNEDYLGKKIIQPGLSPIASTARGAWEAGKGVMPVPFSVSNLIEMLRGNEQQQFEAKEMLTTLLFGQPPRHLAPEGTRMTKHGLRPVKHRPEHSVWDQILTGRP